MQEEQAVREALATAVDGLDDALEHLRREAPESSWIAAFTLARAHLLRAAAERPVRDVSD